MTKYAKILDFLKKIVYNTFTIEKILKEWEKIPLFSFEKEKFNLSNIEQKTELLVEEPIRKLGYELYDVEYIKEGKDYFLRIYIDSENGINLEDCEKVSNVVTELLDKDDYIVEQYFLEISSPGIERILKKDKHLNDNIGANIQVKLFKPLNGQKQFIGTLDKFDENEITIGSNNTQLNIDRKNIAQIKTIYNW